LSEETPQPTNFLLPGKTESLDITTILEPLLVTIKAIADSKEIELVTDIPTDLPLIKGNAQALSEVLNNLLDNAVKYTPSKGQITVRIEPKDNLVKISIEDTGYGIPEADREHLFTRYYRGVQAKGDIPGTGLGLAIAKKIIEQMQGDIEVISPNNRSNNSQFPGTIFTVWLSTINSEQLLNSKQ
jgi:signal transduction histidine kinase